MNNIKGNLFFSLIWIILGVFLFIESLNFPGTEKHFPLVLSVLIVILSFVILLINYFRLKFRLKEIRKEFKEEDNNKEIKKVNITKGGIMVVLLTLYIFIFEYLGYIISTTFLVFPTIYLIGFDKKKKIPIVFLISIIIVLFIFLIFKFLFKIRFPSGILFR